MCSESGSVLRGYSVYTISYFFQKSFLLTNFNGWSRSTVSLSISQNISFICIFLKRRAVFTPDLGPVLKDAAGAKNDGGLVEDQRSDCGDLRTDWLDQSAATLPLLVRAYLPCILRPRPAPVLPSPLPGSLSPLNGISVQLTSGVKFAEKDARNFIADTVVKTAPLSVPY